MNNSGQTDEEANLNGILTNLVDRLWSIVTICFATGPVVCSLLHCVLQQETNPSWQFLAVRQALHAAKVLVHQGLKGEGIC